MGSVALEGFGSGGGAALNFKVVGNPQPESPKENTIWVNTDVPIGAWYFNATQPENLNEGDVWFSVGTSSPVEFNALKKNGIQVYPLSAKQMVSGSLVDVEAKIYQGGAWVDWSMILFDNGAVVPWSIFSTNSSSVTINEKITIAPPSGSSAAAYVTDKKDVTGFTKLKATVKYISGNLSLAERGAYVGVTTNVSTDFSNLEAYFNSKDSTETEFEANIANISGERYILLGCYDAKYEFTKVWLE